MDTALVTSHSQALSGLLPGTTYHYRVESSDGAGSSAISGDFTFTTLRAAVTFSLLSSLNPSASGVAVTLTTTITGSAGATSGTVTFKDNGTTISGCSALALSGATAQCIATSLVVGTHSITVTYSGDATYLPGTSSAFAQTVNAGVVATFRIVSNHYPSTLGQEVTLTETLTGTAGTPSGSVTFYDNGTPIPGCASLTLSTGVAQCTTSSFTIGTHLITVAYAGDAAYRPGTSSPATQIVNPVTFRIVSNHYPSTLGQEVTLTETLTGGAATPTGTVTFYDNGTPIPGCTSVPLSAGVGQCTTSSLTIGTHLITVTYSGDATYPPGNSSSATQIVNPAAATFRIVSNHYPSLFGQEVTLTETLTGSAGTPSGTVTFYDSGTPISGCTSLTLSAGVAQCTTSSLTIGTHLITVTYSGNAAYRSGTSVAATQIVNPAAAAFRIVSNHYPSTLGQEVTLTETLTGSAGTPSGTVTFFYDNGTLIPGCTSLPLTAGVAQCTTSSLTIGTHLITVTYSGDAAYQPGTSVPATQIVNPAVPTFRIVSNHYPSILGQEVVLTETLTGSAGTPSGTVTFNDNGVPIPECTSLTLSAGVAQCSTSSFTIGTHLITVTYSGDIAYRSATSVAATQIVNSVTFRVVSNHYMSTLGQEITLTETLTGGAGTPSGNVTFYDNGTPIPACTSLPLLAGVAQCTTSSLTIGTHLITVTYSGDATYPPSTSTPATQIVN
jgi:hypothetical protein